MRPEDSHSMNGGDGTYSYGKNSYHQRCVVEFVTKTVQQTILEKLEIKAFPSSKAFRLADMGCSVGPNTFYCVEDILEAVKQKFATSHGLGSDDHQMPEFQVFFNDLVTNDFNTLFKALPPERHYFTAAAPGSFYGRLFPSNTIDFVHASYSLQWLSHIPEEMLNKDSPAWNKGRVHYTNASDEVLKAYSAQYAKDMARFLDARADELVEGGMMVLILPSIPDGLPHSSVAIGQIFDLLSSCLMEMATEERISEDLVDSFNIPMYSVPPGQMRELIEKNGCFSIEKMELGGLSSASGSLPTRESLSRHFRAGVEGIITEHFGGEIVDELFERFLQKADKLVNFLAERRRNNMPGSQLLVCLKRKCHS